MKIVINGESADVPGDSTVVDLLKLRGSLHTVAVAVNQEFVPRARHATRTLHEGDEVEIVAPMQGG